MTTKQIPLEIITTEYDKFMGFIVDVTRKHIEMGEMENANMCPVSIAVREFFQNQNMPVEVTNNNFGIYIRYPDRDQDYYDTGCPDLNPYFWAVEFDEGEEVDPIKIAFNPEYMTADIIWREGIG